MDTAAKHVSFRVYQATRFRDGLLVALLISCPSASPTWPGW